MVRIPSAREIGRVSTRSGRIAPSGPTVSVGEGIAQLGNALTHVAYDLNDLRTQEAQDNQNKAGFDLETKIAQFRDAEEQAFLKAREGSGESGIGFTRQFIEGYQQRANEFGESNFAGLNDAQKERAKQSIMGLGNSLYGKAYDYEQKAKTLFYDRTTNQGLDTVRGQIKNNAAPYEELKRQGLAAIDAADMPEAWKAERRAQWQADAAESKWQWKFSQSPQEALSQIRGPVGGNVGRAYQRLISKGWAPHQAAGIVGNLSAESGASLNTRARNPGDGSDGSDSIGLAQWNGNRAKALKAFAAARGTDWTDFDTQIDFVDHELRTSERSAGENLARSTNAEEAAAAFTGYERPAGWSPSNARGSHNWAGRRDAALRIAGENPSAEDADLDAIPYDRREQLAAMGESRFNQQISEERQAAHDDWSVLIATQPKSQYETLILNDRRLDNGDRATLIKSLNAAMTERESVDQFVAAFAAGQAIVNPFDETQRKAADKTYEKMFADVSNPQAQTAFTSDFVKRTQYIPARVQDELRYAVVSNQPAVLAQGMEAATVLSRNAPQSFAAFEGSANVQSKLDAYRAHKALGYRPEEAARKVIDTHDPEKVRQRDAILKSEAIQSHLKGVKAADISAIFDKGIFSASPDVGGTTTPQQLRIGTNIEAEAAIVADYKDILQDAIGETYGDIDAAKVIAGERMKRVYGVSDFSIIGDNVVLRNPVEVNYPVAPDGTHDYIRDQLAADMKADGYEDATYYLQGDVTTQRDVEAGRSASYLVFYRDKDGLLQMANHRWVPDMAAARKTFEEQRNQTLEPILKRHEQNRVQELRIYPEGRGDGAVERFSTGKLYRGIARENSPMGRAAKAAAEQRAADDESRRVWHEQWLKELDEKAKRSNEFVRSITPTIKIGGKTIGGDDE